MSPEPDDEKDSTTLLDAKSARWPGVIVSLLVPGFGLYRAGLTKRGIFWFFGILGFQVVAGLTLSISSVPLILTPVLTIIMLVDSFRPGKMTCRKWLTFFSCFLLLALLPSPVFCIVHAFTIESKSMVPTLCPGDRLIVNRLAYSFSRIKRGDIVAFRTQGIAGIQENSIYVKRVAAFAGERVQIQNGAFLVNGKRMTPADGLPAINYTTMSSPGASANSEESSYVVPKASVFVLGDNINNSADSRIWGGVHKENIYGKATKIYYPFSRSGVIK